MKPQRFSDGGEELWRCDAGECPHALDGHRPYVSAYAFESRSGPVADSGSITWTG